MFKPTIVGFVDLTMFPNVQKYFDRRVEWPVGWRKGSVKASDCGQLVWLNALSRVLI